MNNEMKNRTKIGSLPKTHWTIDGCSKWWRLGMLCVLFLSVSIPSKAQFININVDVPPKTGLSNTTSYVTVQGNDSNGNQQKIEEAFALALSCAENLVILATLHQPGFLRNKEGKTLPLSTSLSIQNDGSDRPPSTNVGNHVIFPISNSNLLIDNMIDEPQVLNAYIFIKTGTGLVPYSSSTYTGEIILTIEYN